MTPRLTVTLRGPVLAAVDEIAARRGLSRRQVVMRAVGVLQACEGAALDGLDVGAADREALDRVILTR